MRPWVRAANAACGSVLVKEARCSSSDFHASTFFWIYSSVKPRVPSADPRCRLPECVMRTPVPSKVLSAVLRYSALTISQDFELLTM